jgi:hypothetical protein
MPAASPPVTATIVLRNGRFVVTAPTGTVGVGETIDEAWRDLTGQADSAAGAAPSRYAGFIAKTSIVAAAVVAATVAIAVLVGDVAVTRAARIGEAFDLKKIEHELSRAADPKNDFTPEQRERLTQSLRAIVARVQPLVQELAPLVCAPPR